MTLLTFLMLMLVEATSLICQPFAKTCTIHRPYPSEQITTNYALNHMCHLLDLSQLALKFENIEFLRFVKSDARHPYAALCHTSPGVQAEPFIPNFDTVTSSCSPND
jgi:hypothetical protein